MKKRFVIEYKVEIKELETINTLKIKNNKIRIDRKVEYAYSLKINKIRQIDLKK